MGWGYNFHGKHLIGFTVYHQPENLERILEYWMCHQSPTLNWEIVGIISENPETAKHELVKV